MKTIYLGGSIAGLTYAEATEWRKIATSKLENSFKILDPMRDKEYMKNIKLTIKGDTKCDPDQVFNKALSDIDKSDIILCNLSTKSLGSLFENGYAYAKHKPVVTVVNSIDLLVHPFITEPSTLVTRSLTNACDYILEYLKNKVSLDEFLLYNRKLITRKSNYIINESELLNTFKHGLSEEVAEYLEAKANYEATKTDKHFNELLLELGDVLAYLLLLVSREDKVNYIDFLNNAQHYYVKLLHKKSSSRNIELNDHISLASKLVNGTFKRMYRGDNGFKNINMLGIYVKAFAHVLMACDTLKIPVEHIMKLNIAKINKRFTKNS
jgi:nucleoside 2-deoxyribosyltransferase/NTP pyrophosphatase (non-canonical NTP hydrolase)